MTRLHITATPWITRVGPRRFALALSASLGLLVPGVEPAAAQQPAAAEWKVATELAAQAGTVARFSLETRVTKEKPYAADAVTEFVQTLGDGNRIVRRSTTKLYRDSEGRTRREVLGDGSGEVNQIFISDPVSGVSVVLDPTQRVARRAPAMVANVTGGTFAVAGGTATVVARSGATAAGTGTVSTGGGGATTFEWTTSNGEKVSPPAGANTRVVLTEPMAAMAGSAGGMMVRSRAPGADDVVKEDLGEQVIDGVVAKGTRATTTIAAGAIGNDQPITIVSEQWFSSDLEVLVMTRHSDPRVGETTYRLTNVTRSEPDRSLFATPGDYTISEPAFSIRKPPQ